MIGDRKPEKVDYTKENIEGGDKDFKDSEYLNNEKNENNFFRTKEVEDAFKR
jgi:hypothetical protein